MATVPVTGVVTDASGNPPGPNLRVFAAPIRRSLGDDGLVTGQSVEALVDQQTGEWVVDLISSTELQTNYRFRAWWTGSSPGSEVWQEMDGVFVPPEGGHLPDFIASNAADYQVWEGPTPPDISMRWLYTAPDGVTPYVDPEGVVIEHGTLVDWSAR